MENRVFWLKKSSKTVLKQEGKRKKRWGAWGGFPPNKPCKKNFWTIEKLLVEYTGKKQSE
jgi:hypothetical protein